jgi:hypothetical protein
LEVVEDVRAVGFEHSCRIPTKVDRHTSHVASLNNIFPSACKILCTVVPLYVNHTRKLQITRHSSMGDQLEKQIVNHIPSTIVNKFCTYMN